jgi:hypothetical protein
MPELLLIVAAWTISMIVAGVVIYGLLILFGEVRDD